MEEDDDNSTPAQTRERRLSFTAVRTISTIGAIDRSQDTFRNNSLFAEIERSEAFQAVSLLAIVVHSCWICIDVEWNHVNLVQEDGGLPLQPTSTIVDNVFCVYFVLELIIRALAFSRAAFCCKDFSFLFDAGLTVLMVLETWLLPTIVSFITDSAATHGIMSRFSSLRLLRTLRMARLVRTMSHFPDLWIVIKGVMGAAKPVFFISLFLILLTFVFATTFTGHIGRPNYKPTVGKGVPEAPELFSDLFRSMLTLFTSGVLLDSFAKTVKALKKESAICFALFFVFVGLSGMALLNMLVAVLCRVMEDDSRADVHTELQNRLLDALLDIDVPPDRLLHKEEWKHLRSRPDVLATLAGLNVAPCDMQERLDQCQEALFGERASRAARVGSSDTCTWRQTRERAGLRVDDFLEALTSLRWDLPASSLDIETMRVLTCRGERLLHEGLDSVQASLARSLSAQRPTESTRSPAGEPVAEQSSSASASSCGHPGDLAPLGQCDEHGVAKGGGVSASWLQGVPTEILFLALKGRRAAAPLDPLSCLT